MFIESSRVLEKIDNMCLKSLHAKLSQPYCLAAITIWMSTGQKHPSNVFYLTHTMLK